MDKTEFAFKEFVLFALWNCYTEQLVSRGTSMSIMEPNTKIWFRVNTTERPYVEISSVDLSNPIITLRLDMNAESNCDSAFERAAEWAWNQMLFGAICEM